MTEYAWKDANGETRLRGTIDPAPGGSQPVEASYNSGLVLVGNGSTTALPFDTLIAGTELLDRSDPAAPTFLGAGVYGVSFDISSSAPLTVGGWVEAIWIPQFDPFAQVVAGGQASHPEVGFYGAGTLVATAGLEFFLYLHNVDGAADRSFSLDNARIVKTA